MDLKYVEKNQMYPHLNSILVSLITRYNEIIVVINVSTFSKPIFEIVTTNMLLAASQILLHFNLISLKTMRPFH